MFQRWGLADEEDDGLTAACQTEKPMSKPHLTLSISTSHDVLVEFLLSKMNGIDRSIIVGNYS